MSTFSRLKNFCFPVLSGIWLLMPGWICAQTNPPSDGIQDETRALSKEIHQQLAQELKLFREDLKCDAWITASSFTPSGVTVRRQAQITRSEWSGMLPAVLMAYDRATNSSGMSFSPDIWQRYPAAELVEIMQETRRILTDARLTLDERFAMATRSWIDRLRIMESVRLRQSLWIQRSEKRFMLTIITVLAGGAAIAAVLGIVGRRRYASADRRFRFPEVHVGLRLGAAYGGGVTAEIKTNAGAQ